MDKITEMIMRRRMHGLYLSRKCEDIEQLSHELLGLHCWFHRNAAFSALIRGVSGLSGWKHALVKTWIHHALHGVARDDLPALLAVHSGPWRWGDEYKEIAEKAVFLMEDGVYSRAEMREIFADEYNSDIIGHAFSAWGGVFCELARLGRVAFRDMTSRDFDLIDAEPTQTRAEVLPELFRRFITAYGPATFADAAWFFGLGKEWKKELSVLDVSEYSQLTHNKQTHYYIENNEEMDEIPDLTLLSGFDPLIVTYVDRSSVLPVEYKKRVIMSSGICLPTIAVNGQIAGLWNIKKNKPTVEFFTEQPKYIVERTWDLADNICWQTKGHI